METLDEHIRHCGNFKAYRGHKAQYEKLYSQYLAIRKAGDFGVERKAQKALNTANEYYESSRTEIVLFETADKYLRGVLQERFDPKKLPPITMWQKEQTKLTAEKNRLNREFVAVRDDTKKVEQFRRSVDNIMRGENRREQPKRAHDMEL